MLTKATCESPVLNCLLNSRNFTGLLTIGLNKLAEKSYPEKLSNGSFLSYIEARYKPHKHSRSIAASDSGNSAKLTWKGSA
jgi:hypothetical protein